MITRKNLLALLMLVSSIQVCAGENIPADQEDDQQLILDNDDELSEREYQLLFENLLLRSIINNQKEQMSNPQIGDTDRLADGSEKQPGVPLNPELMQSIISESPQQVKTVIERFKLAKIHPHMRNVLVTDRLLLAGPPGVGKTDLAKTIAHEIGRPFIFVQCSLLSTEYQNSGAQNIKRTIEEIQDKKEPYVVILDEIHCLIDKKKNDKRSDQDPAVALWQIIDECAQHNNILFIGTTNSLENMPEALKSRFTNAIIEVPLPGTDVRKRVIEFYGANACLNDAMIKDLVKKTNGYSCREIKELIREILALTLQAEKDQPTHAECRLALRSLNTAKSKLSSSSLATRMNDFVTTHGGVISFGISIFGFAMNSVNFIEHHLHLGPYKPQALPPLPSGLLPTQAPELTNIEL